MYVVSKMYKGMCPVKVSSYIARYPVLRTAQSALHFIPGRPVHSKAILTSLGSISCKTFTSHAHTPEMTS